MMHAGSFLFGLERVLSLRPPEGRINARYLRGFSAVAGRLGADPRHLLERHGIDPVGFEDPNHHLDCSAVANLLEYCSGYFDDPLFGFRLADYQDPDVFGAVTTLARAAPRFEAAVQVLTEYLPFLHYREGFLKIVRSASSVEIRWSSSGDFNVVQQPNYHCTLLMIKTFQMLGGPGFHPRYLGLACDVERAGLDEFRERTGCRIFRSEDNLIGFSPDDLDRPVGTSDHLVFELLGKYLEQAKHCNRSSFLDRVVGYVHGALNSGHCTIEQCASRLDLPPRAVQRRLAAEGTSFSAIVESERVRIAKQALGTTTQSLDDVAFLLGYSDQTCFGRAFKRWTGMTPHAYRSNSIA